MKSLNDSLNECRRSSVISAAKSRSSLQSYEKYQQRLKTFELFKWFAKPVEFSPVECARHGWMNLAKDTLKCVVCSSLFYYYSSSTAATPLTNRIATIDSVAEKRAQELVNPKLLIEKHNKNCPWRSLTVSNQVIRIDLTDEDKAYTNFLLHHSTLKKCKKLPLLSENVHDCFQQMATVDTADSDDCGVDSCGEDGLNRWLLTRNDSVVSNSAKRMDRNRTALILACSGWSYKQEFDTLSCDRCLRSIGLWLYKRSDEDDDEDDDAADAAAAADAVAAANEPDSWQSAANRTLLTTTYEETDGASAATVSATATATATAAEANVFGNTQPYSDEIIVRSIVSKMLNSIEIEEQHALKNAYFIDKSLPIVDTVPIVDTTNTTTTTTTTTMSANVGISCQALLPTISTICTDGGHALDGARKRKLDQTIESPITNANSNGGGYLTKLSEHDKKKKGFHPVAEHYTWCPWIQEPAVEIYGSGGTSSVVGGGQAKRQLVSRTMCHKAYEIVRRLLVQRYGGSGDYADVALNSTRLCNSSFTTANSSSSCVVGGGGGGTTNDVVLSSERLLRKLKSAQSILINCTSKLISN